MFGNFFGKKPDLPPPMNGFPSSPPNQGELPDEETDFMPDDRLPVDDTGRENPEVPEDQYPKNIPDPEETPGLSDIDEFASTEPEALAAHVQETCEEGEEQLKERTKSHKYQLLNALKNAIRAIREGGDGPTGSISENLRAVMEISQTRALGGLMLTVAATAVNVDIALGKGKGSVWEQAGDRIEKGGEKTVLTVARDIGNIPLNAYNEAKREARRMRYDEKRTEKKMEDLKSKFVRDFNGIKQKFVVRIGNLNSRAIPGGFSPKNVWNYSAERMKVEHELNVARYNLAMSTYMRFEALCTHAESKGYGISDDSKYFRSFIADLMIQQERRVLHPGTIIRPNPSPETQQYSEQYRRQQSRRRGYKEKTKKVENEVVSTPRVGTISQPKQTEHAGSATKATQEKQVQEQEGEKRQSLQERRNTILRNI